MKQNCWEMKKCGREMGGSNVSSMGVCPASTEVRLDGIHDGTNGGRTCWVVAGTFCEGEVQGNFANKFQKCQECDFFQQVKKEQGGTFKLAANLIALMK
jgi:hypothetical protein